jgi:hypothetical protein
MSSTNDKYYADRIAELNEELTARRNGFELMTNRLIEQERKTRDAEARNALFEDCIHRALKIWHTEHPESAGWPDGAHNLAWAFEQYQQLHADLEVKQSLLDEAIRKGMQLCEQNGTLLMENHAMREVIELAECTDGLLPNDIEARSAAHAFLHPEEEK